MGMKLTKLLDAMETAEDSFHIYYDTKNEKLVYLEAYGFSRIENEHLREQIENEPKRFLRIPTKFMHEYKAIESFVHALPEDEVRRELAFAIQGKGAFRRFKQTIRYHGMEQQWYTHREKIFREVAVRWCQEHGVDFEE